MNLMTKAVLHNGEYILETQTGKGMFEITYQATHAPSGQAVVIKTFGERLRQHSEFEQFKQQLPQLAHRLQRCQHPHLVQVLDYFEEDSLPYLVMEDIQGKTLAQIIQTEVLPETKALTWIHQVSEALSVLHKAGLLHQDLKPEKIILRQDTESPVLCHSITKFTAAVMPSADNFNFAGYAALEQFSRETPPTQATDIYALAATFYCLLAGRPPLPASVREILHTSSRKSDGSDQEEYRQLFQKVPRSDRLNSEVKWAIWRGLELAAQKRPQTVEAWLSLLCTPPSPNINSPAQPIIKPHTSHIQKLQPSLLNKNPNPQTSLDQNLVTTFKIPPQAKSVPLKQPETPNSESRTKSPLRALLITGAIAAAAGIGFGFALRLNSPTGAGSTLMHTEQSFPPTSNWPMSQPPAKVPL
jgi:eukaryotic-like serine/threonine-protein kinase